MFLILDETSAPIPKKRLKIEESTEVDQEEHKSVKEDDEEDMLDEEFFGEAMGLNPNVDPRAVVPLTQAVIDRWTSWVKKETSAERLSYLTGQYILPDFLIPPKLNVEVIGFLKKSAIQRDEQLKQEQELIGHAMGSLAGGQFLLMRHEGLKLVDKETRVGVVEVQSEAAETMAHLYYEKTLTRKGLIIRYIDSPEMKDLLRGQKESDEFLFGKDLKEKMKDLKVGKQAAKDFGARDTSFKSNSAEAFLERRRKWKNTPWQAQSSQNQRWSFNKNNPFPFSTNNMRPPSRGRGRGSHMQ